MVGSADHRLIYGDHPDQFVEVWPPDEATAGSIVLIHGGYWRQRHDLDSTRRLAAHLAASGWRVFNIEYRRVDDHVGVWSEMASDVLHAAGLAIDRPRVIVGHSAGGHLALWLGAQPGLADVVLALAPLADLARASALGLSTDATSELFGGPAEAMPDVYASASPIELVPLGIPTVVVHGSNDVDVPQLLSERYVEAASRAGDDVRYLAPEGVDHMDLIEPEHRVWRELDAILAEWAGER